MQPAPALHPRTLTLLHRYTLFIGTPIPAPGRFLTKVDSMLKYYGKRCNPQLEISGRDMCLLFEWVACTFVLVVGGYLI